MMSLTKKQRRVMDEILDFILPPFLSAYGLTISRASIKARIWTYINADPWIHIKLARTYQKLKELFKDE